ncbi:TIGR04283 family arsenosugar biosynthesis glycosyltransferase [Pseudodesulfovibrio tunisiensis]|uniref:TIGR04283 family arsenosugar biosynthesis glycosyltransferase n=1 Tax=Pseudodesulfovibrio tunisiensis TaxID=463192 RepID=UPI001FB3E8A6|nr:TIGR04283 family arsenosugar biosynthesis glycosyltransferase [Pseudodesulfovibrio tunisiensis]
MRQNTTAGLWSVVIPVLNEAAAMGECIRHVRMIAGDAPVEIIVADGDPTGSSLNAITDPDVIRVHSGPGRGIQMNRGAEVANGDMLLFLHADTALPEHALRTARLALSGRAVAGAFSLSMDSDSPLLHMVAWFANIRSRLERVPYGDQAQFIRTDIFRELGGFAEIPLMEDVELFTRLKKRRLPIAILKARVRTSARRWEQDGVFARTLKNWIIRIRYALGTSPQALAHGYAPPASPPETASEKESA